jgi:hypothetical protein
MSTLATSKTFIINPPLSSIFYIPSLKTLQASVKNPPYSNSVRYSTLFPSIYFLRFSYLIISDLLDIQERN